MLASVPVYGNVLKGLIAGQCEFFQTKVGKHIVLLASLVLKQDVLSFTGCARSEVHHWSQM